MGAKKLTYFTDNKALEVSAILKKGVLEKKYPLAQNRLKAYPYGYGGHERDDELMGSGNSYDMGARMYNSRIGRTPSIDPHAKSYPSLSPYAYVGNMPTWAIDPDGRDIIIISAPSNVAGLGHAAVLIGNDKDGYRLYSDNGTDGKIGSSGAASGGNESGIQFGSLKEFANSSSNFNEDGSVKYTAAVRIVTDKETDAKMREAAAESVGEDYNVFTNNCADACSDALEAGGLDPGYRSYESIDQEGNKIDRRLNPSPVPNVRFEDIKENNPTIDVSDQIKPDESIVKERALEAKERNEN